MLELTKRFFTQEELENELAKNNRELFSKIVAEDFKSEALFEVCTDESEFNELTNILLTSDEFVANNSFFEFFDKAGNYMKAIDLCIIPMNINKKNKSSYLQEDIDYEWEGVKNFIFIFIS